MTIISINDSVLDLYPETSIAITFQRIDIGELSLRYLSRTNEFKIPRTNTNELIFGISGNDKVVSTIPYSFLPAKIIQNGIEVIPDGKVKIISVTEKEYSIQILENMIDIFSSIKGKYISDINPIANSAWDAAGIDTARTNTTGIVSAIMSWGKSGAVYQVNYFLPCFYYQTIVTSILQSTGLTLSGSILSSTDFTNLVMPFNGDTFTYPQTYVDTLYDKASGSGSTGGAGWGNQTLSVTSSTNGRWNSALTNYYSPPYSSSTYSLTADFAVTLSLTSVVWSAGTTAGRYWLELIRTRSAVDTTIYTTDGTSNVSYASTSGTITASTTAVQVNSGDTFRWALKAAATGGTPTLNSSSYSYSDATVIGSTTISRSSVAWNLLWKQISCTDIINDFFNRFGIIPKQIGNTLYLKTIQDIMSDTSNAVDWSLKRASSDYSLTFETNYAESNTFDYTDSDLTNEPELGRGTITISYATEKLKNIFTSIFETCVTKAFTGFKNLAHIPVYGTSSTGIDTFENPAGIKVLTLRARTTESSITFNASARTDYKLAYFVDSSNTIDTGFQYFINKYYSLLSSSIQNNKVITRSYLLTELDVANFDPHLMIYDDGYFIVNKISNFVPNKLTKVELLKVQ